LKIPVNDSKEDEKYQNLEIIITLVDEIVSKYAKTHK